MLLSYKQDTNYILSLSLPHSHTHGRSGSFHYIDTHKQSRIVNNISCIVICLMQYRYTCEILEQVHHLRNDITLLQYNYILLYSA